MVLELGRVSGGTPRELRPSGLVWCQAFRAIGTETRQTRIRAATFQKSR
jgi:hypothetical protein